MEPMWLPDGGSPDVPSNEDLAQRANQPRNAISGDEVGILDPVCNTSFSKSVALANGIQDAHFVSRYSISGLVCPLSQVLIGRNVWGLSVWQPHRFHRGLGTSTRPNTVLTAVLPESLVVYR